MPKKEKYDLICVGAGPGGFACAKTAADLGLDVLLVERANVAQWQGRMFAQLVAEMKKDKDFSEAPIRRVRGTLGQRLGRRRPAPGAAQQHVPRRQVRRRHEGCRRHDRARRGRQD